MSKYTLYNPTMPNVHFKSTATGAVGVPAYLSRKRREERAAKKVAAEAKAKKIAAAKKAKKIADAKAAKIAKKDAKFVSDASKSLQMKSVSDPSSVLETAEVVDIDPDSKGTLIDEDTGKLSDDAPQVEGADVFDATTVDATSVADDVEEALEDVEAVQGAVSTDATVTAAEGELSEDSLATGLTVDPSAVSEVTAGTRKVSPNELVTAEGQDAKAVKASIASADVPENIKVATTKVNPNEIPKPAQIKEKDMATATAITDAGLSDDATAVAARLAKFSVDAGTLAEFKEGKIEAQDTVQGQLAELMKSFDDGTPSWAAGAMRAATAAMSSRGLGSSSMAGAAIVQAAMESAIPIASADANAFREMKMGNLNRQQQISLTNAAAQQGVKLANFNAEQQTALQNSQNAFSLQSQNLSNMQQVVLANAQIKASLQGQNLSNRQQSNLAEAARYAEVSNLNLNNRQQGIMQDNANAMQVNLANMSSKQQAYLANAQLAAALQGKKIDNKQQAAMANAARFAEAGNITFSAAEQAKLHNSELLKTVGLANLNAKQAAVLQNAATMASMDMANLSNRQQAAIQNANAFLQMDMTNLSNEQETAMFKAQSMQQALFTDAAADNAAKQFNASSENQTNQFFATMSTQVQQFNAGMTVQRDQFNAGNSLAIAQANAVWRQNAATVNTAAQNESNRATALAANNMTQGMVDNVWQRERDIMDYAFRMSESADDRALNVFLSDQKVSLAKWQSATAGKQSDKAGKGYLFSRLLFG